MLQTSYILKLNHLCCFAITVYHVNCRTVWCSRFIPIYQNGNSTFDIYPVILIVLYCWLHVYMLS